MHLFWSFSILLLAGTSGAVACHPSAHDASTIDRQAELAQRDKERMRDFLAREKAGPRFLSGAQHSGHQSHDTQARLRITIDDSLGEPMFTEYWKSADRWNDVWTNWLKSKHHGCIVMDTVRWQADPVPPPGVLRRDVDVAQQSAIASCIAELSAHSITPWETENEGPAGVFEYRVYVDYDDAAGPWRIQRDNPGIQIGRRHLAGFMQCVCRLSAPGGDYRESLLSRDCSRFAEGERARSWWPDDKATFHSY